MLIEPGARPVFSGQRVSRPRSAVVQHCSTPAARLQLRNDNWFPDARPVRRRSDGPQADDADVFGQIGPYVIERPIGQGGMASVFLARDTRQHHDEAGDGSRMRRRAEGRAPRHATRKRARSSSPNSAAPSCSSASRAVSRYVPEGLRFGLHGRLLLHRDGVHRRRGPVAGDPSRASCRGSARSRSRCSSASSSRKRDRFEVIPPSVEIRLDDRTTSCCFTTT